MKTKEEIKQRMKEYYQINKQQISEKAKLYRQRPDIKAKSKQYQKQYNETNKEKMKQKRKLCNQKPEVKAKAKLYHQKNKAKLQEQAKLYRQKPEVKARRKVLIDNYRKTYKEKIADQQKQHSEIPEIKTKARIRLKLYRQKPEVKARMNLYRNKRKQTDPNFKIRCLLGCRVWEAITKYSKTGKIMSSIKYGIDYEAIIEHLKPFPENIQDFHIDHIKPLCLFNLEITKEIKKSFSPQNHQWLLAQENLSKGAKYEQSKQNKSE